MQLKARIKPNIHDMNKNFNSFVNRGLDTIQEAIRNRAFIFKLTQHKRKRKCNAKS